MNKEKEKIMFTLIRDLAGVLVIAFTLFACLTLVSYNPQDPSFNRPYAGKGNVVNRGGVVGAYISDGLVQTFGSGAFFFPVVTLLAGWALIRGQRLRRWPFILGGGVFFLAGLCAMLSLEFPADPFFGKAGLPGGIAGYSLHGFLVTWLNRTGAALLLSTALFISLLAMTGLSANSLIEGAADLARSLWTAAREIAEEAKAQFQEWLDNREKLKRQRDEERQAGPGAKQESKEETKPRAGEPIVITRASDPAPQKSAEKKRKKEAEDAAFPVQEDFPFLSEIGDYQIPPLSLLDDPPELEDLEKTKEQILNGAAILEKKLADFGIEGRVVQALSGPVITLYELEPAPGVKVSRILSLTDDLSLAMRAPSVRILAPVPGKAVVGVEIPNVKRDTVFFKEIVSSDAFAESKSKLVLAIGKDHVGKPAVQDLAQVPHLLVAGSTGSGKSVGINAMICSILLNATPEEVKMIMVDPKMLELSIYDGIPHLIAPVVTNPKKAAAALQWAVIEMERRYKMMADTGVRNISGFNQMVDRLQKERGEEQKEEERKKARNRKAVPVAGPTAGAEEPPEEAAEPPIPAKLPYIVIVIDELADLMLVASKGVEDSLARLAQMARASGIHLIVATQRPSVDVLTGVIKANFPARISYQVTSRVDSRTILDSMGAEKLLGKGDMLFLPPGSAKLQRIHGAMLSDAEINRIIKFIKRQKKPDYKEEVFAPVADDNVAEDGDEEFDEKYDEAVELVAKERQASISMIQRRLRVGYNRAARMIEIMEREGVVGPSDGIRPREVYVKPITFE